MKGIEWIKLFLKAVIVALLSFAIWRYHTSELKRSHIDYKNHKIKEYKRYLCNAIISEIAELWDSSYSSVRRDIFNLGESIEYIEEVPNVPDVEIGKYFFEKTVSYWGDSSTATYAKECKFNDAYFKKNMMKINTLQNIRQSLIITYLKSQGNKMLADSLGSILGSNISKKVGHLEIPSLLLPEFDLLRLIKSVLLSFFLLVILLFVLWIFMLFYTYARLKGGTSNILIVLVFMTIMVLPSASFVIILTNILNFSPFISFLLGTLAGGAVSFEVFLHISRIIPDLRWEPYIPRLLRSETKISDVPFYIIWTLTGKKPKEAHPSWILFRAIDIKYLNLLARRASFAVDTMVIAAFAAEILSESNIGGILYQGIAKNIDINHPLASGYLAEGMIGLILLSFMLSTIAAILSRKLGG